MLLVLDERKQLFGRLPCRRTVADDPIPTPADDVLPLRQLPPTIRCPKQSQKTPPLIDQRTVVVPVVDCRESLYVFIVCWLFWLRVVLLLCCPCVGVHGPDKSVGVVLDYAGGC